ncbi:MAG: fumarate reductase subunit C [Ignavibacteriales bacterium]|nr:fumarate reductase subunit C [Ignavibacteriales bacterium]
MSEYSRRNGGLYQRRTPIFWWTKKWSNVKFITRELTSVFVAGYALVLLFQIRALFQGPETYANFLEWLKTPISITLHAVGFLFVLFHSITWFNLAPKAMVIRLGKKTVPGSLIAASNYAAWLVVSGLITWILAFS